MKVLLVATMLLLSFAEIGLADSGLEIDRQVADAVAYGGCVNLTTIQQGAIEKHFAEIFTSKKSKERWLAKIEQFVERRDSRIRGEAFVSEESNYSAPEPFIQIVTNIGAVYTFFRSGRMACETPMVTENYVLRNMRPAPLGNQRLKSNF